MRRNQAFGNHVFSGSVQAGLAVATLLLSAASVRADSPGPKNNRSQGEVCGAAYTAAQQRQHSGDLVAASELYQSCADEGCGVKVWQDCMTGESKLHSDVPSVVVAVSDHNGEPLVDVKVEMDGRLLTSRLDGLALPINPGTHEFLFFAGKEAFAPQTVTVAVGDRNRVIFASGRLAEAQAQR
jgi:hypothetical protein